MTDSSDNSATLEQLVKSNARLSRMLEFAHAENRLLEKEVQSSKIQIAGLLAGVNFSSTNHQASSVELVGVMLQEMMQQKHGAETAGTSSRDNGSEFDHAKYA